MGVFDGLRKNFNNALLNTALLLGVGGGVVANPNTAQAEPPAVVKTDGTKLKSEELKKVEKFNSEFANLYAQDDPFDAKLSKYNFESPEDYVKGSKAITDLAEKKKVCQTYGFEVKGDKFKAGKEFFDLKDYDFFTNSQKDKDGTSINAVAIKSAQVVDGIRFKGNPPTAYTAVIQSKNGVARMVSENHGNPLDRDKYTYDVNVMHMRRGEDKQLQKLETNISVKPGGLEFEVKTKGFKGSVFKETSSSLRYPVEGKPTIITNDSVLDGSNSHEKASNGSLNLEFGKTALNEPSKSQLTQESGAAEKGQRVAVGKYTQAALEGKGDVGKGRFG